MKTFAASEESKQYQIINRSKFDEGAWTEKSKIKLNLPGEQKCIAGNILIESVATLLMTNEQKFTIVLQI